MNARRFLAPVIAGAALLGPAAAQAHVTVQPKSVPAGGFTVLNVRVPNERDDANTTKVQVQFPDGFLFVSYQAVPGWSVKIDKEKLDTPVKAFGEDVNEQVSTVTFTSSKGVGPGQFQDFPLSVGLPDKAGTTLTFKAVQTYDNGTVVRWIGAPDADEPAPQVQLTAPAPEGGAAAATPSATAAAADNSDDDAANGGGDDDGDGNGLAIAALVVAALALLTGIAALARGRGASVRTD